MSSNALAPSMHTLGEMPVSGLLGNIYLMTNSHCIELAAPKTCVLCSSLLRRAEVTSVRASVFKSASILLPSLKSSGHNRTQILTTSRPMDKVQVLGLRLPR